MTSATRQRRTRDPKNTFKELAAKRTFAGVSMDMMLYDREENVEYEAFMEKLCQNPTTLRRLMANVTAPKISKTKSNVSTADMHKVASQHMLNKDFSYSKL